MRRDSRISPPANFHKFTQKLILIAAAVAILLVLPRIVRAEVAGYEEMQEVAQNWITYIVAQTGDWAGATDPAIVDVQDMIVGDTLVARYYAVSSGGYVIVPVLKELPPVKAYSEVNPLNIYDEDGFALLLRQVLQQMTSMYVEKYGSLEASQPPDEEPLFEFKNHDKWMDLAVSPKEFVGSASKALDVTLEGEGPLLTSTWHQGAPYNNLCPMGDGGRCAVGCVATAAAQIMNYHRWPPAGEGSHSYNWGGDNSCGGSSPSQVLTADFSDPYVYDDSPASVAEISYEMGVAFDMDYGYCGSGAYTMYGASVFPTYFRYDESAHAVYRNNYTSDSWFNLVKNDINKGHPTLYRIYSHAIVCDGWRVSGTLDQYHFNYGWGGSQNAWYTVDNLYCPWSGCDPMVEAMVVSIIPKNGSPWLSDAEFTDDLGDGDGLLEDGETIEMTVTVANYGGAAITDVTLNLSIDDASIPIVDGFSTIGIINPNDSVSNSADPFVFDIPVDYVSRLDSFVVEISWNGGAGLDTLVVEKGIGRVSIMLVDDDENGDRNKFYEEALGHFRIPYDVWEFAAFLTPDASQLSNYDMVIWFTGDYRSSPISTAEVTSMKGYLDNGGKLFLTGQRIAAQLNTLDPSFLSDYLKTNFVGTQNIPVLSTQAGQVVDTGYMVAIQGGNSASNQIHPDLITPAGGGQAELKYLGSDYFGAVSYSGSYKSVFFSFGYEAVVTGDSRWRDRDSVMSDVLNFFGYQRPGSYPMVSDLAVTPGDPMHLLNHTPDFSWSFFDAASAPQTDYQIQVGSDNSWLTAEMWDSGPVAGSETQVTYAGAPLADGGHYYIRVRSFNGNLWSAWTEGEMRLNSVPAPATDMVPSDLQAVTSTTPSLSHVNSVDGESDQLTYDYEVYADSDMTLPVAQVSDHPSGYGTTSWQVTTSLEDNTIYYWRVRGSDPYETGEWTGLASFWVNSPNSPPEPFDLISPANSASLPGLSVDFDWSASSDIDLYDHVKYTLYYSTVPTFAPKVTVSNLDTTAYSVTGGLEYGTVYYWKVLALDLFGGQTYSTETYSFATINRGDANGDGQINVADAVFIINFIFKSGPEPDPLASGDANCDGNPNVGDAVYIINYVFKNGPEPGCH